MRLEVPLFQRQYVWNHEQQWAPLWDDIARKFTEYLEGRKEAPVHFLGAMVLDQKMTPTTHVEKRQVIDGQQRLTTLQIFLAVFRDFCREHNCDELAKECEGFTLNKGMMAEPDDKFKVLPTQVDRSQFSDVVTAGSITQLEKLHPPIKRPRARKLDPRPRMVEAYLFFYGQLHDFFIGTPNDPPLGANAQLSDRLEECFQALKNSLQVVVIDLEQGDDAQVIFETLNARGEPLLPADLLRNYIFLRAARLGEPTEQLYSDYWRQFDDRFWREEVSQGRLNRPRSDLFMQHFLASKQTVDIPIKHLFVEYKFWIDRNKPFATVRDELATLARQGNDFRRVIQPKKHDRIYPLASFLDIFDIRTAYPLLLFLMDSDLSDEPWTAIATMLESYLLRRAVCNLTTKNYNRTFLTLTRDLKRVGPTPENMRKLLADLKGDSTVWPKDAEFRDSWQTNHAYRILNNPKIVHILSRLNASYLDRKTEDITIHSQLTVEHVMPQHWQEHWPLPDGSKGLSYEERLLPGQDEARIQASINRDRLVQTLGNLTIITQQLNSSQSNSTWQTKKPNLLAASLLPINLQFTRYDHWDETTIQQRADELFDRALRIWPGPDVPPAH